MLRRCYGNDKWMIHFGRVKKTYVILFYFIFKDVSMTTESG